MAVIVGVDAGLTGAVAWLRSDGTLLGVEDMPVLDGEVSPLLLNAMLREGPCERDVCTKCHGRIYMHGAICSAAGPGPCHICGLGHICSACGGIGTTPLRIDAVVIEWPGIMPKNGAKAAYSMGNSLGTINAVVQLYNAPSHRVAPGVWKRALGLNADKDRSRALATRTWPAWADSFKRKKDDGRAEAALIAYWWLTKKMGWEAA